MITQNTEQTFYISSDIKDSGKFDFLKEYSRQSDEQVYILNKPLLERDIDYEFENGIIVLIPNKKITFIDMNNNKDDYFFEFVEDVLADVTSTAKTYEFLKLIGRQRKWKDDLICFKSFDEYENSFLESVHLEDELLKEKVNIIISLFIGSINSVEKIGEKLPANELDIIKQRIILFDGDQTRFIFEKNENKILSIHGLAGTGKTELLFHKLKELYLENDSNRIAFTCYSKTLANSLRKRVKDFFSYMRIGEQIEWNERLWVIPCWGSASDYNSGVYSHIVNKYNLTFYTYSKHITFKEICEKAIEELKQKVSFDCCFDYILIDESQDFPDSFFELCSMVTSKQVIKAGDIFQNINEDVPESGEIDILLNRCYRTDNKTLMFAHAISLGIFEKKLVRWFNKEEWQTVGYNYSEIDSKKIKLTRNEVKKVREIEGINPFVKIFRTDTSKNFFDISQTCINIIKEIYALNPTVKPHDIAIVFTESNNMTFEYIRTLCNSIESELNINTNTGFDTKKIVNDKIFITNKYNIKGLEFPFVICVAQDGIIPTISSRNTIYMAMTRSFLSSYLILNNTSQEVFEFLDQKLHSIDVNNALLLDVPSKETIEEIDNRFKLNINETLSLNDAIKIILEKYHVLDDEKVERITKSTLGMFENSFQFSDVEKFILNTLKGFYGVEK